jgi:hypothetical protein
MVVCWTVLFTKTIQVMLNNDKAIQLQVSDAEQEIPAPVRANGYS